MKTFIISTKGGSPEMELLRGSQFPWSRMDIIEHPRSFHLPAPAPAAMQVVSHQPGSPPAHHPRVLLAKIWSCVHFSANHSEGMVSTSNLADL